MSASTETEVSASSSPIVSEPLKRSKVPLIVVMPRCLIEKQELAVHRIDAIRAGRDFEAHGQYPFRRAGAKPTARNSTQRTQPARTVLVPAAPVRWLGSQGGDRRRSDDQPARVGGLRRRHRRRGGRVPDRGPRAKGGRRRCACRRRCRSRRRKPWPGPGSGRVRSRRCGSASRPVPRSLRRSAGPPAGSLAPDRSRWAPRRDAVRSARAAAPEGGVGPAGRLRRRSSGSRAAPSGADRGGGQCDRPDLPAAVGRGVP